MALNSQMAIIYTGKLVPNLLFTKWAIDKAAKFLNERENGQPLVAVNQ